MKKIIRLTESDLTRIVRRVIKENEEDSEEEFWNKKLKAFGIGFAFPVILGLSYKFGMSIVDIIQTLVSTAFLTGIFSKKFIDSVRPKNKNKD